jgi:hypothetical protein
LEHKLENMFPIKWKTKCKTCTAVYMAEYRDNNAKHISTLKKDWKAKNIDRVRANDVRYAVIAVMGKRKARAKWRKANLGHVNSLTAARRKHTKQRTPVWVGLEELWLIKEVYELAALRTKMFGFAWHVDHIIPLQGEIVSGLHVPNNLQVIPGVENSRKRNRYTVETNA